MFLIITHLMRSSLTFHNSLIIATAYFRSSHDSIFEADSGEDFASLSAFFRIFFSGFFCFFRYFTYRSIQFFRWLRRTNNFFIFIFSATKIIFQHFSRLHILLFHYSFGAGFIIFLLFTAHRLDADWHWTFQFAIFHLFSCLHSTVNHDLKRTRD